jgi:hypothetical protein
MGEMGDFILLHQAAAVAEVILAAAVAVQTTAVSDSMAAAVAVAGQAFILQAVHVHKVFKQVMDKSLLVIQPLR